MSHRLVVLISGSGSNLKAILDATSAPHFGAEVVAVISNRPHAPGLQFARERGIPAQALDHTNFPTREAFDTALLECVDRFQPDTVVLAGFMRILTVTFVAHFKGKLLNIHPSLLPKFPGLHTHQRALDAGETEHGCSIHFVTEELDGGPLIARAVVPVLPDDNPPQLAGRVQAAEHQLYPTVLQWRAQEKLTLTSEGVLLNERLLAESDVPTFRY